jgi:thymidylate synthase (FAD)
MEERRKPRLLIIGHARHGKDTFAAMIAALMDLDFTSSSEFVGRECIWETWGKERYATFQEMFDDRVNYRSTWKNLILAYNTPNLTRTATTMLNQGNDMYVGMRDSDEFQANHDAGTFDKVIWVDAREREPLEPQDSMGLNGNVAHIWIDNNGPETDLIDAAKGLQKLLHEEGFEVAYKQEKEISMVAEPNKKGGQLITEPTVFAIGQTQFNREEFAKWIDFNGHDNLINGDSPLARLWDNIDEDDAIARMIEFGGRHCYRAWEKGRDRKDYIRNIIDMEHGSVLEHATINWAIQGVSRSLSLELARHRVGIALSQESQRYVDAADINFVVPPIYYHLYGDELDWFLTMNQDAVDNYNIMQGDIIEQLQRKFILEPDVKADTMMKKRANEAARALLPNDTETRFLWTTNMRLLRHFLFLRGGSGADLEIRRLAVALLKKAQELAPEVFGDMTTIAIDNGYGVPIITAV